MTSYNKEQFNDNYPPNIEDHFWIKARNAIIFDLIRKSGMGEDKILEIGCGRGIVVEYLRHRGLNCIGCELAPVPIPEQLAPYIQTGTDVTTLAPETRNAITGLLMFDVIEHIEDSRGFVADIVKVFPNARRLLITVPSGPELWSRWDEHFGHFRRYTKSSLAADIENTGFSARKFYRFFHSLYVLMRLMNVLHIERGTAQHAPDKPMLHDLLAKLFVVEYRVAPAWLVGTSLAVLAQRDSTKV